MQAEEERERKSPCLIVSITMDLFTGLFPQTYSLAYHVVWKKKNTFQFQCENWYPKLQVQKTHTSIFGDHMQVHLKTATSHFKSIKKLWVNLKQVDSKSSHSKESLPNIFRNRKTSVNANWTNKRTCFKQPWMSASFQPNTLNTTHLTYTLSSLNFRPPHPKKLPSSHHLNIPTHSSSKAPSFPSPTLECIKVPDWRWTPRPWFYGFINKWICCGSDWLIRTLREDPTKKHGTSKMYGFLEYLLRNTWNFISVFGSSSGLFGHCNKWSSQLETKSCWFQVPKCCIILDQKCP